MFKIQVNSNNYAVYVFWSCIIQIDLQEFVIGLNEKILHFIANGRAKSVLINIERIKITKLMHKMRSVWEFVVKVN